MDDELELFLGEIENDSKKLDIAQLESPESSNSNTISENETVNVESGSILIRRSFIQSRNQTQHKSNSSHSIEVEFNCAENFSFKESEILNSVERLTDLKDLRLNYSNLQVDAKLNETEQVFLPLALQGFNGLVQPKLFDNLESSIFLSSFTHLRDQKPPSVNNSPIVLILTLNSEKARKIVRMFKNYEDLNFSIVSCFKIQKIWTQKTFDILLSSVTVLNKLINEKKVNLSRCSLIFIDSIDCFLSFGCLKELRSILQILRERHIIFTTWVVNRDIKELCNEFIYQKKASQQLNFKHTHSKTISKDILLNSANKSSTSNGSLLQSVLNTSTLNQPNKQICPLRAEILSRNVSFVIKSTENSHTSIDIKQKFVFCSKFDKRINWLKMFLPKLIVKNDNILVLCKNSKLTEKVYTKVYDQITKRTDYIIPTRNESKKKRVFDEMKNNGINVVVAITTLISNNEFDLSPFSYVVFFECPAIDTYLEVIQVLVKSSSSCQEIFTLLNNDNRDFSHFYKAWRESQNLSIPKLINNIIGVTDIIQENEKAKLHNSGRSDVLSAKEKMVGLGYKCVDDSMNPVNQSGNIAFIRSKDLHLSTSSNPSAGALTGYKGLSLEEQNAVAFTRSSSNKLKRKSRWGAPL